MRTEQPTGTEHLGHNNPEGQITFGNWDGSLFQKLSVPLGCYDPNAPSPWVAPSSFSPFYKL